MSEDESLRSRGRREGSGEGPEGVDVHPLYIRPTARFDANSRNGAVILAVMHME